MTVPAAFPSVLRCSGRDIVDSSGYVLPVMKGFCAQAVPWSAQAFADMYAKGARMIRAVVFWDRLEPSPGVISPAYVAKLDQTIQRCQAAGLYVLICFYFGPNGKHMPAWAQGGTPASRMGNYIVNGQNVTTYLAMRYGDPSDPLGAGQYTPAVIGFGINEPTPDYYGQADWVVNLVAQQAVVVDWFRRYAPDWIASVSAGWGSAAPIPNAPGSGQTAQDFTGISPSPSGLSNWWLELHDYFWATTAYTNPGFDGRTLDGRPRPASQGGIQIKASSGYNYPPVVNGHTPTACDISQMAAAWYAPYTAYCQSADVPLVIAECGFMPGVVTGGQANIADKLAQWAAVGPAAVLQWDYGVNQAQDPWCARPGPGAAGADADGWQEWTNAFMSAG
jgi:hypothetical protein